MKGPPVKVLPDGVDAEPRKTGHRYIDFIVAGSAILISLISLVVAVEHGLIMKRLVAANSWPLLQYETGNFDTVTNKSTINLVISNAGVGPAVVKRFSVSYKGRTYENANYLLSACCGFAQKHRQEPKNGSIGPLTNVVESSVIRAGDSKTYLALERDGHEEMWDRLDKVRFKLKFNACYCSVFNECWESDLTGVDPNPVDSCPIPPPATGGTKR